jgi:molybdopterin adenylyltransferase
LTVSDRCSRGEAEDASGDGLVALSRGQGWTVLEKKCVPDEKTRIALALLEWCDEREGVDLIFTTGKIIPAMYKLITETTL